MWQIWRSADSSALSVPPSPIRDSGTQNDCLLYTILPIQKALGHYYNRQLKQLDIEQQQDVFEICVTESKNNRLCRKAPVKAYGALCDAFQRLRATCLSRPNYANFSSVLGIYGREKNEAG